jgi:hypothetical protein
MAIAAIIAYGHLVVAAVQLSLPPPVVVEGPEILVVIMTAAPVMYYASLLCLLPLYQEDPYYRSFTNKIQCAMAVLFKCYLGALH